MGDTTIESEFPKRLFQKGKEPEVVQINNNCRTPLLTTIKKALPLEYDEVKRDPTFAHVFAMHENGLGYSARTIQSMLGRQLATKKKHELWFVFGNKPLRFSLQEFHAVTGFTCQDNGSDFESWTDDNGFWSKVLKRKKPYLSLKNLTGDLLPVINTWTHEDKIRLVYICVIAGLVMAIADNKVIPHLYIKLAMDLHKVRTYPWGLKSFEFLLASMKKVTKKLSEQPNNYVLDGFSYAFQIWIMEAIPSIGSLLGEKINSELTQSPRCSNWKGIAKISYEDVIIIEESFKAEDVVHPYISWYGNNDLVDTVDFSFIGEIKDPSVIMLHEKISVFYDFKDHIWECKEAEPSNDSNTKNLEEHDVVEHSDEVLEDADEVPNMSKKANGVSGSKKRCRKKNPDHGAEMRKKKVLCERLVAATHESFSEDMKSFLKGLFEGSFSSFEEKIGIRLGKIEDCVSNVDTRLERMEEGFSKLKESIHEPPVRRNTRN